MQGKGNLEGFGLEELRARVAQLEREAAAAPGPAAAAHKETHKKKAAQDSAMGLNIDESFNDAGGIVEGKVEGKVKEFATHQEMLEEEALSVKILYRPEENPGGNAAAARILAVKEFLAAKEAQDSNAAAQSAPRVYAVTDDESSDEDADDQPIVNEQTLKAVGDTAQKVGDEVRKKAQEIFLAAKNAAENTQANYEEARAQRENCEATLKKAIEKRDEAEKSYEHIKHQLQEDSGLDKVETTALVNETYEQTLKLRLALGDKVHEAIKTAEEAITISTKKANVLEIYKERLDSAAHDVQARLAELDRARETCRRMLCVATQGKKLADEAEEAAQKKYEVAAYYPEAKEFREAFYQEAYCLHRNMEGMKLKFEALPESTFKMHVMGYLYANTLAESGVLITLKKRIIDCSPQRAIGGHRGTVEQMQAILRHLSRFARTVLQNEGDLTCEDHRKTAGLTCSLLGPINRMAECIKSAAPMENKMGSIAV